MWKSETQTKIGTLSKFIFQTKALIFLYFHPYAQQQNTLSLASVALFYSVPYPVIFLAQITIQFSKPSYVLQTEQNIFVCWYL